MNRVGQGFIIFFVGLLVGTGFGMHLPKVNNTKSCDRELNRDGLLIKTNEFRIANKLPVLFRSEILNEYAQLRSNEMAENKKLTHETKYTNYFEWSKMKDLVTVSEDIADKSYNSCETVDRFLASPTHRHSLANPKNTHLGIGVKDGYVTLILGQTK